MPNETTEKASANIHDIECAICLNKPVSIQQMNVLWISKFDSTNGKHVYFCCQQHYEQWIKIHVS